MHAKLDRIDINILTELQNNGRVTNIILSERVGLSPSPCLKRLKRLEKLGFIKGYHAEIDLEKLGEVISIFTEVTLAKHDRQSFYLFEKELATYTEITECHAISGGFDYLCKFSVKNMASYQHIINTLLAKDELIREYYSYVVTHSPILKKIDLSSYLD